MATVEQQMMERLLALERQNEQLAEALRQQQQQQQQQAEAAAAAAATAAENAAERGPGPSHHWTSQIDTRMIGRPETFDGITTRWKDWPIVFRSYMGAAVPRLTDLMHQVEGSPEPAMNAVLPPEDARASQQLYFVLIMCTKGEPLDIVVNAGNGEGLEAWRLMCQRFEPVAHSRQAGMLLEILAWDFTGDVLLRMEAMERRIADYEKAGEKLSDAIRVGIVMRQLPEGPVKQHLIMNAERLAQWHVFRNEVCNIRRAQLAVQNAATPMEIGALNKGGGKGGKGKGKGRQGDGASGNLKDVTCHNCQKKGHYARDCWAKPGGGKGGKTGKGKGSQRGGKGTGKGTGKGQGVQCWKCGGTGHYGRSCPNQMAVGALAGGTGSTPAAPAATAGTGQQATQNGATLGSVYVNALEVSCHVTEELLLEVGTPAAAIERLRLLGALADTQPRRVTWSVDSGAAVTIIPRSVGADYPTEDTQSGVTYKTASGEDVPDLGMRRLLGTVRSGGGQDVLKGIKARVGNVTRGLLAVSELIDAGNEVHFTPARSWVRQVNTGTDLDIERRGKVFEMNMDLLPFNRARVIAAGDTQQPFRRPASP